MTIQREQMYAALFALLKSAKGLNKATRVLRNINAISADQLPAMFFEQRKEHVHIAILGQLPVYRCSIDVAIFIKEGGGAEPIGEEKVIPAADLNNLLDAVEAVIAPNAVTGKQTLGGLVQNVWVEGDIIISPCMLGKGTATSIAIIPFTILAV